MDCYNSVFSGVCFVMHILLSLCRISILEANPLLKMLSFYLPEYEDGEI